MNTFQFKFGSLTYNSHIYSILIRTREVTEQEKGVVFRQASGARKIPQLKTDVLHCCSLHTCTHKEQLASIHKALLKQFPGLHNCARQKKIVCEYITHWRDFVSVENKCYVATAVIQMPAVRLALGGDLWR